jgi:peptidoglycan/xylan/chitin deacetylase (PgdA/CDA1 family)
MRQGPALRAFYALKPLIPRQWQIFARRIRAQRIWRQAGRDATGHFPHRPLGYRWPEGASACLLLTHDVETDIGQRNIARLTQIEDEFCVRSCWNFVVRRYEVDTSLLTDLRAAGHEIGVHGVYHDGRLFDSAANLAERLPIMQDACTRWEASGFRSPSLLYDESLLETLPFDWDSSMPAWDPFAPMSGGCRRYTPFRLNGGCVELPVTMWQDFTIFEELQQRDIEVWRQQVDALYRLGGLINIIVHPDYMLTRYRLDLYRALLLHLRSKAGLWVATPSEVARWENSRHRSVRNEQS